MTYDGHGRLKTRHIPQQDAATATVYNYNADDSIQSVTDARGATVYNTYNSMGLLTHKAWTVPPLSEIPVPDDVTFSYDNLGNRTQMTDGLGVSTYEYDPLSRMTAETRDFADSLTNAPNNGVFRLEYTYTIGGQLKSLRDPYNYRVDYAYDKLTRLQTVDSPTAFDGISTYANSPTYNARGVLTGLSYGNGTEMNVTGFNAKLQATGFAVNKGTTEIISKEYQFYADGALRFIEDVLDETFDRSYKYDHLGRTVEGKAGTAARGETPTGPHNIDQPYSRTYQHDAFGKITNFDGYFFASESNYSASFTNGRNLAWSYDANGNVLQDIDGSYKFDAAGQLVKTTATDVDDEYEYMAPTKHYFDGDGKLLKRVRNAGSTDPSEITNYLIRSSILDRIVSEVTDTGKKNKTFVAANGVTLAEQRVFYGDTAVESLKFIHQDASGTGAQQTTAAGTTLSARAGEYDPMGRNVADASPYISLNTEVPVENGSGINLFGSGEGYRPGRQTYKIDGFVVPESRFMAEIETGAFGGMFGLIEMASRMSAVEITWERTFEWATSGTSPDGNLRIATHSMTVTMGTFRFENWAVGALISSQSQRLTDGYTQTPLTEAEKSKLKIGLANLTKDKECNKFITGILEKLKFTRRNGYPTTDINELFTAIFENPTNSLLAVNYLEVWENGRIAGLNQRAPYATTAFGRVSLGKEKTTLRFDTYVFGFKNGTVNGRPFPYDERSAMAYLVHELIHAYGNTHPFRHLEQARTGFATAQEMGIKVKALPNRDDYDSDLAYGNALNAYFTGLIEQACPGGK